MEVTRAQICDEAHEWIGTPYQHLQSLKGCGCDCVGLLHGITKRLGLCPNFVMPVYSPQWHMHKNEEVLIHQLKASGCTEKPEENAAPGDIIVMKFGRVCSHTGLLVNNNKIIHARFDSARTVIQDYDAELRLRMRSVWQIPGVI